MEQRLQCLECSKVRYRIDSQDSVSIPVPAKEKPVVVPESGEPPKIEYEPVELVQCLEQFVAAEPLEYSCPSCSKTVTAQK